MYSHTKSNKSRTYGLADGLSGIKISWYITSYVSKFLGEIIQNKRLDFDEYRSRESTISEAFGLLWQNPKTGECPGRSGDDSLHVTAVACALLDLYAKRRIEFRKKKNKKGFLLGRLFPTSDVFQDYVVTVIDRRPTYTFLDDCIFNLILDAEAEYTAIEWMSRSLSHPSHVLMGILRSLVNKGIFVMKVEQDSNDVLFPTINTDPQRKLRDEIRMIGLHNHVANGFMWPLLKLTRGHDHVPLCYVKLVDKLFDDADKDGLDNIDKNMFPDCICESECKKKHKAFRGWKKRSTDSFDSPLFD
ncbi:hypothetical protein AC249_AIPGENE7622 [Exaiptasia diaphana]|nr:hypothetical protein AC249_AIPGENE7622 [Exaiptasia diaphana]